VPDYLTPEELLEMFGAQAKLELLDHAIKFGILEIEGDRFRVASPRLLHAGAELAAAGIPLDAVFEELRKLRRDIDRVAGRMVDMAEKHIFDPYGDDLPPPKDIPRLTEVIRRLRPLAEMVVDAELARAIESHIRAKLGDHLGRMSEHRKRGTAS